jgi:hypothetical protein
MKTLRTIGAVILAACGVVSAHNAMDMVKFHSSTAITVAGTEFPAGDNTIQMLDSGSGNVVLLVRSVESGAQAMVLASRLNGAAPHGSDKVQVTLQRRGNAYGLDQIWISNRDGFQVLRSNVE